MIVLRPPAGGGRKLPPAASRDPAPVRYILVLLWSFWICVVGGAAFAHTLLDASEPADGASLSEPVREVKLRFAEHVTPLVMRMLQPKGDIVRLTDVTASGSVVIVRLPVSDQHGTNIVSWRVMSDDGHPVGGTVSFSVAAGTQPVGDTDLLEFRSYRLALWLSGFAQSICITLAVGGALFRAWVGPATKSWLATLIVSAAVAGLLAEVAGTAVQTVDGLGEDFTAVGWDDLWWTVSRTAYGQAAWFTAAGLLCSSRRIDITSALDPAEPVAARTRLCLPRICRCRARQPGHPQAAGLSRRVPSRHRDADLVRCLAATRGGAAC